MDYSQQWSDGWAGPRVVVICNAKGHEKHLQIDGLADFRYMDKPLVLSVLWNGQKIQEQSIKVSGNFELTIPLLTAVPEGLHSIEIISNVWFVPNNFTYGGDYRPLAWRVRKVDLAA
jgi:hypothetical protein